MTAKKPIRTPRKVVGDKPVSHGRHEYQCSICSHPQRAEIEEAFVNWISPRRIGNKHGVSRDAVYRHAHALSLMESRRRNVRAALEKIIERASEVKVNAAAVVSAVSAYSRINASGEWVQRTAKTGVLPNWFETTVGATAGDSPGGGDER